MTQDITEQIRQRGQEKAAKKAAVHAAAASSEPIPAITADALISCLVTAQELDTRHIPPREKLLGQWLCRADLGFVFAPRGVGKTWLSMALPKAISQGLELGLWEAGELKAKVLYIDGEMPLELTRHRSRGLGMGKGDVTYLHHEVLFDTLGSSLNIGNEAHRQALTELIVSKGYELLILDNLSCLAAGVDENKGDHYEPIKFWLLELRRRKITVIVVHHAGRAEGVMRGHSKREDDCSWILSLTSAKEETDQGAKFISHFSKPSRNTGEPQRDLLWHFTSVEDGTVSFTCEEAQTGEFETMLRHISEGVSCQKDLAEMMDKPKGTISKWIKRAKSQGRVKGDGNALTYIDLIPPGQSFQAYVDS
jgi:RecA-family ATPase